MCKHLLNSFSLCSNTLNCQFLGVHKSMEQRNCSMLLLVARIILFEYAEAFATGDGTIRPWLPDVLLAFYLFL
jgi:hypothetical protein